MSTVPDAAVDAYLIASNQAYPHPDGPLAEIRAGLTAAAPHMAAQALRTYADQQHPHAVGHARRVEYGTGIEYDTECGGCGSSWSDTEGGCTERVELLRASYALVNPPGPDCNCHETGAPCNCADAPVTATP